MRLLHRSYNTDGQRHADRCVRPRPGEVPLRYADYAPTGFHISSDLVLRDSSCQPGCVRLDHHELLSTPQGELCFHRGGHGYEDAANVKYGHVAVDDLIDDPGPPTPSGGHRGAPASVTSERLVVRVRSIPPSMHYKRPSDTRAGSNRGARFLHYGDPAADQGDREDVHYTYLVWSFLNTRGGGMVRSLLRDGDEVDRDGLIRRERRGQRACRGRVRPCRAGGERALRVAGELARAGRRRPGAAPGAGRLTGAPRALPL